MFSKAQYTFGIIFAIVFIGFIIWTYIKDIKLHKYYYKNVWITTIGIVLAIALFRMITFWLHD